MRCIVVIQARAGSTRYPGKVLADLRGRPLLAHVIERAQRSRCADGVVVATTTAQRDDAVYDLARALRVGVTRGPEDDVLSRYVLAARDHNADILVRITGDCPLLDPRLIDRVVRALVRNDADYASNICPPSYPDGYDVEAFTVECLMRMDSAARLPYEREHVTPRARENRDEYRCATVRCRRDLSSIRLTVDVPEDLRRIEAVLATLPPDPPPGLGAVLANLAGTAHAAGSAGTHGRDERYHAQRRASRPDEPL